MSEYDEVFYNKLKKKDWSDADILKAYNIVERNQKKTINLELHFYVLSLLIIFGNLISTLLIIPVLLNFNSLPWLAYSIVGIISLLFGILINYAFSEIEILEDSYSTLIFMFLIFIVVFNSVTVLEFANKISLNILTARGSDFFLMDPFLVSIIYLCSYLIPYFIYKRLNRTRLIL